jgi:hypothetical protein
MRELTTIGNLASMRRMERRARLLPMRGIGWMGATNPNYVPPTLAQVDAEPPGPALSAANVAMLEHFQTAGVPSEHTSDPFVLAFQQAYNADPASWAKASPLGDDGGYGSNTNTASNALVDYTGGGVVPPVNAGASPVAPQPVIVSPASSNVTVNTMAVPSWVKWTLGLAVAGGLAYGAARLMKKRRRGRRRRASSSTTLVLA